MSHRYLFWRVVVPVVMTSIGCFLAGFAANANLGTGGGSTSGSAAAALVCSDLPYAEASRAVHDDKQLDPRDIASLTARAKVALATTNGEISLSGLEQPVEVLRDKWGIPHIYAKNAHDLFYAQGFVQAQDRLWQMDLWRRTTLGTLAEIIGPEAFERDRFARLVDYRGDMDSEWASYGPDAKSIIESFVAGVNASIEHCKDNLPIEFQLTGLRPEPWTSRVCLGRMAGFIMCRNATGEVLRAQLIRELGLEQATRLMPIDPFHEIQIPPGLDLDGIDQRVVARMNAVNAPIQLPLVNGAASSAGQVNSKGSSGVSGYDSKSLRVAMFPNEVADGAENYGSNNWTIAGRLTATGKPILANDPHRPVTLPSLRYLVHLNCPPRNGQGKDETSSLPVNTTTADYGWNVIGGTEPALPGVAIGHNDRIAWGMTIVGTDQADIFVEETHPDDPSRYRVGDEWQPMRIEHDQIRVRGESEPRKTQLKFTRHGPVIFEDPERHRAYALRWTGSEPGTAGYMGALAIDRARNWTEFLKAAARWKVPSENLAYADVDGHIGWIAAALTPIRTGWDGLLPVSGAVHDWAGFLSTTELPQRFDPLEGYIATANHNILPNEYPHTLSYEWSAPFRFQRIDEVMRREIASDVKFSVAGSMKLQHDVTSVPARRLIELLRHAKLDDATQPEPSNGGGVDAVASFDRCVEMLCRWDGALLQDSAAAALYTVWQSRVTERVLEPRVPEKLWQLYSNRAPLLVVLDILERPDTNSSSPDIERRVILAESLREAIADLTKRQGSDPSAWQLGKLHQAHFKHMLAGSAKVQTGGGPGQPASGEGHQNSGQGASDSASDRRAIAEVFNLPSVPRGGDANAPIATGGPNFQQTTGASYRQIIDLADWDRSVATSVPGQSGQPTSQHYGDLLPLWARGEYIPLMYSRAAVESAVTERLTLVPRN